MDSRKSVASAYSKYMFVTKEEALKAKRALAKKYPSLKMKVSEFGTLFCHTNGSLIYEWLIEAEITALRGTNA